MVAAARKMAKLMKQMAKFCRCVTFFVCLFLSFFLSMFVFVFVVFVIVEWRGSKGTNTMQVL